MSAELFKFCLGANRLIYPNRVFLFNHRSKCFKTVPSVTDVQMFKPAYVCRLPLQRISSEMAEPVRKYCILACVHTPYSNKICSLQTVGHNLRTSNEINGLCRSHCFQGLDALQGYRTSHALKQAVKEKKNVTDIAEDPSSQPEEKLSLFKRYKKMLKEYWYVLIPVHVATSLVWFGSFYYVATCGFDIVPFLEKLGVAEVIIEPLRKSSLGYIAVASALYKIATPARYMVTLGGTTVSINYLTKYGLIKPVPSKAKIKSMIQNKLKQEKQTKENS